jgi:hypothetical protein
MASKDTKNLQKARADAIRQARDQRRREIEKAPSAEDRKEDRKNDDADRPGGPNYVDLIDRAMRTPRKAR